MPMFSSPFDSSTKALKWCTWVNLGMLAIALIGMAIDERTLLGENVWHKPVKFGLSIPVYCITIALLLKIYPYSFSVKKRISNIMGWALILEVPLVMFQAFRGVRSHFNTTTPLDGIIFGSMGLLILLNTLALGYMMFTTFTKKLKTSAIMQRAIQFAWLGMIVSIVAGQQMLVASGHSVGVEDGGAGMPMTHWSTEGGDWRAVHFLGMHGIQFLPLLTYFLEKKAIKNTAILVTLTGMGYLIAMGYLYWRTQVGLPALTV
ncbi:MAG: hypothetical protein AAF960_08840 [Bacteroidota bacterium]